MLFFSSHLRSDSNNMINKYRMRVFYCIIPLLMVIGVLFRNDHSKTCLACHLLSFFSLIFHSQCFPVSGYVCISCSFHIAMRFCITIVKREQ